MRFHQGFHGISVLYGSAAKACQLPFQQGRRLDPTTHKAGRSQETGKKLLVV